MESLNKNIITKIKREIKRFSQDCSGGLSAYLLLLLFGIGGLLGMSTPPKNEQPIANSAVIQHSVTPNKNSIVDKEDHNKALRA